MLKLNVIRTPIDQKWNIKDIATEFPPVTWGKVFDDAKHELADVSNILKEQEDIYGTYYPLKKDIFAAFNYTPLTNVKVVILGQDPYHQTISIDNKSLPRAVGLSFSVNKEDSIPSSLQNIYTELCNTVHGFTKPDHGDLREWARQGVLLLNTCLTVKPNQPGSHGDIWLGFINKVFKAIAVANPYCVFMLWGREAQKVKPMLGDRSVIFEAAHPSGLSARRGFFGCNHFNLANDALIRQGKVGINWRISTSAEFNGSSLAVPHSVTPMIHKPLLAPVNVEELPTIIPLKPHIVPSVPMMIGFSKQISGSPPNVSTIGTTLQLPPSEVKTNKDVAPIIPDIKFKVTEDQHRNIQSQLL